MTIYILKKIKSAFVCLAFVSLLCYAQFSAARQSSISVAFANFIKNVYNNTETTARGEKLCVFGSDDISLQIFLLVDEKMIRVIRDDFDRTADYKNCRIIYVAKSQQKNVKYSMNILNKSSALTIATFATFVNDGGMVYVEVGRRNFELTVNNEVFRESKVKIDSSIIGLIVDRR